MEHLRLAVAFFITLISLSHQISLPSSSTYKAGVVEFPPAVEGTPREKVKDNVRRILEVFRQPEVSDLDILVFPEYVINNMDYKTFVPDPKLKISPCEQPIFDLSLAQISCAARSRNVYVVINMLEKDYCLRAEDNCGSIGLNTYNTNIVFDRQGRVISRYRKSHLYGNEWYDTNVMKTPELAIFTTDFNVTFGHFICFDMMFYSPSMVLIKDLNITDIIYPTYWFSELPFLTAVQLQEGWAYGNDVNLLAADASYPENKNTGSGIYSGRHGRLTASIYDQPTTSLLVADVPKKGFSHLLPTEVLPLFEPQFETPRLSKISLLRDFNVDIFETKLLAKDFTTAKEIVCHQDFCCSFEITRELIRTSVEHASYWYRLAAYSGNRTTFQRRDQSSISACAIISCTGQGLDSCGYIFPETTKVANTHYFKQIEIQGSFRKSSRRVLMPTSVDGKLMPLSTATWTMTESDRANGTEVNLKLTYPKSDILTFGMWANYYLDAKTNHNLNLPPQQPVSQNATAGVGATGVSTLLTAMLTMFCFFSF